jgi:hypothetical protein
MKTDTFELMHKFLLERYRDNCTFTIGELSAKLGLKEGSVKTYLSKKLIDVYISKRDDGAYLVQKFEKVSKASFVEHMSQKSAEVREAKKEFHDRLRDRAEQSFFLALEIFNRVTQKNKNEAFCILVVNAWELLLKSIIAKDGGVENIYYKKEPDKSISISDCIEIVFPSKSDPVRKNLEKIVELRDKAVHLLIPELSFDISRLFQSCVINFCDIVADKFKEHLVQSINPGFIALIIDNSNKLDFECIKENYGSASATQLRDFLERFKEEEKEMPSIKFAVPIEYKLVLTKKEDGSDIQLFKSTSSDVKARIVEVARDIDTTHPHLRNGLCDEINKSLARDGGGKLTYYQLDAVIFKENLKFDKSSQFHYYTPKPPTHRYSDSFKDHVLEKIKKDNKYVSKCVESYTHEVKKKTKEKQASKKKAAKV